MMVGATEEEYQDADGDTDGHPHLAKPPQERPTARDGDPQPSQQRRRPDPLSGLVAKLAVPVAAEADTQATSAELEEQRRLLLVEAQEIAEIRRELNASLRVYNAAHGFLKIDSRD